MPVKKTLYQVLQVARAASPEVVNAAYEARLRELGSNAAPEVQSERNLLREAHEILSDPVRKKLYDEKLREDALRALSSGGEEERVRPANARLMEGPAADSPTPFSSLMAVFLIVALAVGGGWAYLDHQRKAEELRLQKERLAAEQKLREAELQKKLEITDWAREQAEKDRERRDHAAFEAQRERERQRWQYEQDRRASAERQEEMRRQNEQRRVDYDRQRQEQEETRRQQQQLERERRLLQELERNRGMKF